MFRAHFGGPFGGPGFRQAAPRQQGGAQAQAGNPVLQLLHLLPVLALLLFTLLSSPGQPVRFAMARMIITRDLFTQHKNTFSTSIWAAACSS